MRRRFDGRGGVACGVAGVLLVTLLACPAGARAQDPGVELQPEQPRLDVTIERDPFRPFTIRPRAMERREPETPLERYDIGSLNLVAILWDKKAPLAMVEDDGGQGYTIREGTRIGQSGGVVRDIQPDRVVIEEQTVDFYGETQKTLMTMRLRPEEEEVP